MIPRYRNALRASACAAALLGATPVLAAEADAPKPAAAAPAPAASKPATVSELVITAEKRIEPGEVVGDIKPDLQLQPQDVAAYGVSSITELLDELAPEIGSNSGRGGEGPAILLNGRRISGFNEIRNLPTESILRVDILPEEAALKYGFSANQRVVNIVLRDHYGSELASLSAATTTAGGAASGQAEAGVTRISGEHRFNIDLKYNPQASLTEAQRNVTPLTVGPTLDLAGNPVDERPFRTLVSESQKVSLNAVYTQPVFAGINATVNGTFEAARSEAERGLADVSLFAPGGAAPVAVDRFAPAFGVLNQDASNWTGHLGISFNRDIKTWRLALTGNYDHADSHNENDTGLDAAALQAAVLAGAVRITPTGPIPSGLLALRPQDSSQSKSDTGNLQFIASGPIWTIPAGQIRTSFRLGATGSAFDSQSERAGFTQSASFSRTSLNAQASVDVPLTSKKNNVLPIFGDLGVNANAAIERQSDFGSLVTLGYGLRWSPIAGLNLIVSHLTDQIAPTQQQIGAAILLTPGARIFDYATGQTVDVTQVSGGNPRLTDDRRQRLSVRATYKPWTDRDLTLRADFNKIHIKNPIATFPAASAAIEAAFPDRFLRDATGELTQVDFRPVNFASQDTTSLRWGFDYSRPIGPAAAPPPRNAALAQLRRAIPGAGAALAGGRRPGGTTSPGDAQRRTPGPAPQPDAGAPAPDGAAPPSPDAGAGPQGPPPGGFGGGGFAGRGPGGGGPGGGGFGGGPGGGGPGGGRGGGQDGRLRVSLFHTVFFDNNFLVRPGGPLLDFLNGAALGGGGGQPRHEIQAQINIFERGYGAELNADWKSGTSVKGGLPAVLGGAGDLDFSDLIKVNARVFADLNQRKTLIEQQPWLKGARVSLSISNLFDQRIKVRDATGATPLNFQPAYVDPLGRTIRIEFRKLFS